MEDNIFNKLSEPLPEEAIQRTKKHETKKAYDTDGYGYQWCVDRFNELLGNKWGFDWEIIKEFQGKYRSGQPFHELVVRVTIWIEEGKTGRSCVGGHMSANYADALKGAITNAFKKTAAFWGVGRDAYRGTIDDDNKPMPDEEKNIDKKNGSVFEELKKRVAESRNKAELSVIALDVKEAYGKGEISDEEYEELKKIGSIKVKEN